MANIFGGATRREPERSDRAADDEPVSFETIANRGHDGIELGTVKHAEGLLQ